MIDYLKKAMRLAFIKHSEQMYGKKIYFRHLQEVAGLCNLFFGCGSEEELVAYLHDIIEDTNMTLRELEGEFPGNVVARAVSYLTDEEGKTRRERKKKTYEKLSQLNNNGDLAARVALNVKLADRVANVINCVETDSGLIYMYAKEHEDFKNAVWRDSQPKELWELMEYHLRFFRDEQKKSY